MKGSAVLTRLLAMLIRSFARVTISSEHARSNRIIFHTEARNGGIAIEMAFNKGAGRSGCWPVVRVRPARQQRPVEGHGGYAVSCRMKPDATAWGERAKKKGNY